MQLAIKYELPVTRMRQRSPVSEAEAGQQMSRPPYASVRCDHSINPEGFWKTGAKCTMKSCSDQDSLMHPCYHAIFIISVPSL